MSVCCQPLPLPVVEEMFQVVARALCDRTGDSPAQRESRTRQMILSSLGFEPRDGVEYMLATLAFGHFQLLLDAMHDVLVGESGTAKARNRSSVVALNRAMLGLLRELREARSRPMARRAAIGTAPGEAAATDPAKAEAATAEATMVPPREPGIATAKQPDSLARQSDSRHAAATPPVPPKAAPIAWPEYAPYNGGKGVDDATLLRRMAENDKFLAMSRALMDEVAPHGKSAADEPAGNAD